MAKQRQRVVAKKKTKLNTQWLNNAMKSIGAASAASFQSIAPNIYSASEGLYKSTKELTKTLRSGKTSLGNISKQIGNSKYVGLAKNTMNQAISDLKSGNLYNGNRGEEIAAKNYGLDFNEEDWGFDEGDFDSADGEPSVTFNYIDEGSDDSSSAMLADTISRGNEAIIKAQKASVDAMVSVNATMMAQNQKNVEAILSETTNINNTLNAILQYHEENTSNFYEAAIAAFEKIGSSIATENEGGSRSSSNDLNVFNKNGGINVDAYKDYVKKRIKKVAEDSPAGMLSFMFEDDSMLEMLVSDPIGGLTKGVIGGLLPKVVQGTIQEAEKTFSDFIPNMMVRMGKWAKDPSATKFQQMLGKIFGVNVSSSNNIDIEDRVTKDAAVFDGVARNAIVEVLPKYARESTAYLREIAMHVTKKSDDELLGNSKVFDVGTNSYRSREEMQKSLAESLRDSITEAFTSTEFGKVLEAAGSKLSGKEAESYKNLTEQLYTQLSRFSNGVDVSDFDFSNQNSAINEAFKSIDGGKDNKKQKKMLKEAIKYMYENNIGLGSASLAQMKSRASWNEKLDDISNNYDIYGVLAQGINSNTDMREFMEKQLGYKASLERRKQLKEEEEKEEKKQQQEEDKAARKENRNKSAKKIAVGGIKDWQEEKRLKENRDYRGNAYNQIGRAVFGESAGEGFKKLGGHAISGMQLMMHGDSEAAMKEFSAIFTDSIKSMWEATKTHFFQPLSESLFGKKDEDGNTKGGIFEGAKNKVSDTWKSLMLRINGKEYTDSQGVKHSLDDDKDSLIGKVTNIFKTVKDSVQTRLFGDKGEDGEEKKTGIISQFTDSIALGLKGWKDALFGGDESDEDGKIDKEKIAKSIIDHAPSAIVGTGAGAIIGGMAGSSLLGMLIGGPVGGAVLGFAGSFLAKSDKFKDWLFGSEIEDADGNKSRVGGFISKKTQDLFKKEKNSIVAGAALGVVKNMIFPNSAGLLGSLVGGPIGGAVMGAGLGLLKNSDMFQKFLYGDPEKGKRGVIETFKGLFKRKDDTGEGGDKKDRKSILKKLGMTAVGAAGAGLSAALIGKVGLLGAMVTPGGPLGAALVGASIGIASQSDKFKDWLFGEKDEETKKRKGGQVGKLANYLHVEVFAPMKSKAMNILDDVKTTIKFDVLENIRLPFLAAADAIQRQFEKAKDFVVNQAKDFFVDIGKKITKPIKQIAGAILAPLRTVVSKTTDVVYNLTKTMVTLPFRAVKSVTKYLTGKIHGLFKGIGGMIKTMLFGKKGENGKRGGGIFGFTTKLIGKTLGGFGKALMFPFAVTKAAKNFIGDKVNDKRVESGKAPIGQKLNELLGKLTSDSWRKEYYESRAERSGEKAKNKQTAKRREQLDQNRMMMAKYLGYSVRDFTEENMRLAEDAAKAQGKKIRWRGGDNRDYDKTDEEKRKEILEKSDAEVVSTASTSTDPTIRALGVEIEQRDLLQQAVDLINMGNELTEEEIEQARARLEENGEFARENERLGFNADGTVREDGNNGDATVDSNNQDPFGDGITNDMSLDEVSEAIRQGMEEAGGIGAYFKNKLKGITSYFNIKEGYEGSDLQNIINSGREKIKGIFKGSGHAHAEGGDVTANQPVLVGDGGSDPSAEEVFIPKTSGKILSQSRGGIKVSVVNFAKTAIEQFKGLFSGKAKMSGSGAASESDKEEVLVDNGAGGFNVLDLTREQQREMENEKEKKEDAARAELISKEDEDEIVEAMGAANYRAQKERSKEAAEKAAELDRAEKAQKTNEDMLSAIKGMKKGNEEHYSIWSTLFSKKGLIGMGLAALLPTIIDNLPSITGFVEKVFDTIKSGLEFFGWVDDNHAREDGNSILEQAKEDADDIREAGAKLADGNVVGAAADFVLDDGQWDAQSGSRANLLRVAGHKGAKKVQKIYRGGKKIVNAGKKVGKGAVKGVKKIANKISGKAGTKIATEGAEELAEGVAREAAEKVQGEAMEAFIERSTQNAVKTTAREAAESGIKTVGKKVATESVEEVVEGATKTGASKVIQMVKEAFEGFVSKIGDDVGGKIASSMKGSIDDIIKKIGPTISKHFPKISQKISTTTAEHAAGAAVSFGLSTVVFVTLSAINGVSGAAKLFQVDNDHVDWKMRVIAGAFGAAEGTLIGSILEIVCELIADILGIDLLNMFACGLYRIWAGEEDYSELEAGKEEFRNEYLEYQGDRISSQYETQKAAGLIGQDVTLDEFQQGVENGTYKADYQSFKDYNTDQHKSIGDHIGSAFVSAGKGIKDFVMGQDSYTDAATGQKYVDNGDGTYQVYDADGNDLGNIHEDAVDVSGMEKTTKGGGIGKFFGKVGDYYNKGKEAIKGGFEKVGEYFNKGKEAIKNINPKNIAKFGKWLITSEKQDVYVNREDGSYYDYEGNHFSAAGDPLKDKIDLETLSEWVASGYLQPDTITTKESGIVQIANGVKDKFADVTKFAKEKLDSSIDFVKDKAKKGLTIVQDSLTKTKNFFVGSEQDAYYMKDGSGYYRFDGKEMIWCTMDGDETGKTATEEEVKAMLDSGILEKGEPVKMESGISKIGKGITSTVKKSWDTLVDLKDKVVNGVQDTVKKSIDVAKNAATGVKNFFVGSEQKAYYMKDGSGYYRFDGKEMIWCTMDGKETGKTATEEEVKAMMDSGILEEGEPVKMESGISKLGKGVMSTVKKSWDTLVDLKDKAVNTIKDKATGAINKAKEVATGVRNLFAHKESALITTDGSNAYFKKSGETYTKYNANGDVLQEGIAAEDVEVMMTQGLLTEGEVKVDGNLKKRISELGGVLKDTGSKLLGTAKEMWGSLKETGAEFAETVKEKGLFGAIGDYFSKKKEMAWFRIDGKGYYVMQKDGTYSYFNMNGDEIETGIEASAITEMKENGILKESAEPVEQDSKAKQAIDKVKGAVSDAWKKAGDTISTGWKNFKNWITGGGGNDVEDIVEQTATGGNGGRGNMRNLGRFGGRGNDMSTQNGFAYYSQQDPRWANDAYIGGINDGSTIGNSGCGPTAMAMVASQASKGKAISPKDMATMAAASGYRDETGTNAKFIGYASDNLGLSHKDVSNPSADYISQQAAAHIPMILNGVSDGSTGSAFTKSGHYVVVVGKDSNGKILVNDPRGKGYSKAYNAADLARDTRQSWAYGNGGFGGRIRSTINGIRRKIGGRGALNDIWMNIVKSIKALIAEQKPTYYKDNPANITITYNGKNMSVRPDCSGYVVACLQAAGVINSGISYSSYDFVKENLLADKGFTYSKWPGWDSLVEGDIIAVDGHVEIFSHNDNGTHYAYNCGSTKSLASAEPTVSAKNKNENGFSSVWRLGDDASIADSFRSANSSSSSSSSSGNQLTDIMTKFTDLTSQFSQKALTGILTGNWDSNFDLGDSSTSGTSAASVSGGNAKEKAYNFLRSQGINAYGTAGLMGNLYAESGLNTNNIQNSYEKSFGDDETYTKNVDSGAQDFVNDKAGYGLAQWTSPGRKQGLLDLANSRGTSIADVDTQLDYLWSELTGTYSGSVLDKIRNASDVRSASDVVLHNFEAPKDQSVAVEEKRASFGQGIYDEFGGKGAGNAHATVTGSTNRFNLSPREELHQTTNQSISGAFSTAQMEELLTTAIKVLQSIDNNTSKIETLQSKNSGGNIIVANNSPKTNNTNVMSSNATKESRNSILAGKIARGV